MLAGQGLAGDFDGSGVVDNDDRAVWVAQFGRTGPDLSADGNDDGVVNAADYTIFRDNYGATSNAAPVAEDDTVTITFGQPHVFAPSEILGNDTDADGDPLTITGVASMHGGTAELRDGLVWFTPTSHGHNGHGAGSHDTGGHDMGGHDSGGHAGHPAAPHFMYTVSDGRGGTDAGIVTAIEGAAPHNHADDGVRLDEHNALFVDVVDREQATAIALRSGLWSDPSVWHNGAIPRAGDRVLIHQSAEVTYDVVSDEALDWLRVDGVMTFATDRDTRALVETFAAAPGSTLNIGTAEEPVEEGVTTEILIDTTNGPMSLADDPTLIGRGMVVHGVTNIYGAEKKDFTGLAGDALAGESFIELADGAAPQGWAVGDTLLLTGTWTDAEASTGERVGGADEGSQRYVEAHNNNERFHDELLEISSMEVVNGRVRVTFNNVTNAASVASGRTTLLWDHTRPDGDTFDASELTIQVANLTRNVVVRSSDPTVAIQERGHFMVMHNINANISNAQFKDLGRTDKRRTIDDPPGLSFDGSPSSGSNARGRYGLHLHRIGAKSFEGAPAMITGNVVWGTPGWGIVHHDSYAHLIDNVVFDVVGAGIVAEDGNELGLWKNNLSVKATGNGIDNFDDGIFSVNQRGVLFDLGFVGSNYWLQGGGFGVRLEGNIAASGNIGFDIVHHIDQLANVETIPVELIADPEVRQVYTDAGITELTPNNAPTRGIDGLVSYNAQRGIHTWLHNRDSSDFEGPTVTFADRNPQSFPSVIANYKLWNVRQGVQNFYSAQFHFRDGLIVGDPDDPIDFEPGGDVQSNNSFGTAISSNTGSAHDIRFDGVRIEGFEYGVAPTHAEPGADDERDVVPFAASSLRNAQIANVDYAFVPKAAHNFRGFSDLFVMENVQISTSSDQGNAAPVADFEYALLDGRIVSLDASAALDPDPGPRVPGDGIVAFAWELDGDGDFNDAFGEQARGVLRAPGVSEVSLKVWDDRGATDVFTVAIDAPDTPFGNAFANGDFSIDSFSDARHPGSVARGEGWIESGFDHHPGGYVESSADRRADNQRLMQVVRDAGLRTGVQTLSIDVRSVEGDGDQNDLVVSLYGINNEWEDRGRTSADPAGVGAVDAQVDLLFETNVLADGSDLDWTTFSYDIDLRQGYEYLYVRLQSSDVRTSLGDDLAIDNVSLTGESPSVAAASLLATIPPVVEMGIPPSQSTPEQPATEPVYPSPNVALLYPAPGFAVLEDRPEEIEDHEQESSAGATDEAFAEFSEQALRDDHRLSW